MWGISILADFRPMGYKLSCCGSLCLGKDFLFKSALGHCGVAIVSLVFRLHVFLQVTLCRTTYINQHSYCLVDLKIEPIFFVN